MLAQKQTNTSLTPMQIHLLRMFSFNRQEESMLELKSVLLEFYRNKVDKETEAFWESHNLTDADMERIMYSHDRLSSK
ncbi:MAG: hypothetical protein LBN71_09305 [Tannerella sp.]|jgi:hypothetical protein|nr:hypothetical protein [Tannerella sp.]